VGRWKPLAFLVYIRLSTRAYNSAVDMLCDLKSLTIEDVRRMLPGVKIVVKVKIVVEAIVGTVPRRRETKLSPSERYLVTRKQSHWWAWLECQRPNHNYLGLR
jgi:hypothetical protein